MYLFGYSSPIDWWLHLCTQIVLLFQNLEVYRSETLRRVCILFGIVVERILLNTGANVIVHKILIVIPCSLWLLLRPIIRNITEWFYVLYYNKVTDDILIPKITRYFLCSTSYKTHFAEIFYYVTITYICLVTRMPKCKSHLGFEF